MRMNRFVKFSAIALIGIGAIGCQSDAEILAENQRNQCVADFDAGKEVTQFCFERLPADRKKILEDYFREQQAQQTGQPAPQSYVQQPVAEPQNGQQPVTQQPMVQGAVAAQPQVVYVNGQPQTQYVEHGPSFGETMMAAGVGSMIGNALSNNGGGGNYNGGYRDGYHYDSRRVTNVTNIRNVENVANSRQIGSNARLPNSVKNTQVAPDVKKNYMDTSKLNPYGARPSPVARSSGMNMGALAASARQSSPIRQSSPRLGGSSARIGGSSRRR